MIADELEPYRHVVRPRGVADAGDRLRARARRIAEVTLEHMLLALCDDAEAALVLAVEQCQRRRARRAR